MSSESSHGRLHFGLEAIGRIRPECGAKASSLLPRDHKHVCRMDAGHPGEWHLCGCAATFRPTPAADGQPVAILDLGRQPLSERDVEELRRRFVAAMDEEANRALVRRPAVLGESMVVEVVDDPWAVPAASEGEPRPEPTPAVDRAAFPNPTRVFGRLVLSTGKQAAGHPVIDGCMIRSVDGWTAAGWAIRWRRGPGRALVVGWRDWPGYRERAVTTFARRIPLLCLLFRVRS